jgi:NDP-sugar pyrophosphorylase family protein
MKAMVLAAGIGSRLRPLTDQLPKALVPVGGVPLVTIVLRRLAAAGVREVIVNTHHHAAVLERYLEEHAPREVRVTVAHEPELLDTGGGLKNVAWFFAGGEPFFLHNADVVSGVDLAALASAHRASGALATLSVRARAAARRFLFDTTGCLCGWEDTTSGRRDWATGPVEAVTPLGFDGIQVISPAIFATLSETGVFSLTRAYLRLAGAGERIVACRGDAAYWADIGSLPKLAAVEEYVASAGIPA